MGSKLLMQDRLSKLKTSCHPDIHYVNKKSDILCT